MLMRKNIWSIYVVNALLEFFIGSFWLVAVLNVIGKGLGLQGSAMALAACFSVIAFSEYPTGWSADRFGRKKVMIAGIGLLTVASLSMIFVRETWLVYSAFFLIGLGLACINGSKQSWFVSLLWTTKSLPSESVLMNLEFSKRIALAAVALISAKLLQMGESYPWVAMSMALCIAIGISWTLDGGGKQENSAGKRNLNISINWKLALIYFAGLVYAVEFAIRNVIVNPFIVHNLSDRNILALASSGLMTAFSGLCGNIFSRKYLKNRKTFINTPILLSLSMIAYGIFEMVCYVTDSFDVFLAATFFAVFTMGWYFPLRDEIIFQENTNEASHASALSLYSMLMYGGAAVVLLSISARFDVDNLRFWWPICAGAMLICALIFLAIYATRLVSVKNALLQKN